MRENYLKILFVVMLAVFGSQKVAAQGTRLHRIDSILTKISRSKQDTNLVKTYGELVEAYLTSDTYGKYAHQFTKNDTAIIRATTFANTQMELARKLKWGNGIGYSYKSLGDIYSGIKDYDQAILVLKKAYDMPNNTYIKRKAANWIKGIFNLKAFAYIPKNDAKSGVAVFDSALKYFEALHDRSQLYDIYSGMWLLYFMGHDLDGELHYHLKQAALFKDNDTSTNHIAALSNIVMYYQRRNNLVRALDVNLKAQKLINAKTPKYLIDLLYGNSARLYTSLHEYPEALSVYQKSLALNSDKYSVLTGMARVYGYLGNYDKALEKDQEALTLFKESVLGTYVYDDLAQDYYLKKDYNKAFDEELTGRKLEAELTKKGQILRPDTTNKGSMVYGQLVLNSPDTLLLRAGINPSDRFVLAEQIFFQNLDNAKKFLSLERQQEIYQNLSLLYEKSGDNAKAYAAYKNYKLIADSVEKLNNKNEVTSRTLQLSYKQREDSISFKQQIAQTRLQSKLALTAKEVELQQANYKQSQTSLIAEKNIRKVKEQQLKVTQVDDELKNTQIKNKQRQSYYLLAGIAALIGLSFFIARNYINQRKSNKIISKEKQRSDDLLLNILPADVAEELKEKGSADAKLFDEVTVLFTDFVNFTTVSQSLTPQELVDELNVCFKAFDGIMTTHRIEKIKTVGDAYLAVSGLPNADANHAANVIHAAKDIQKFMLNRKLTMGEKTFGIRLGVHSGSVVAGIVGVKKFAYDIWGDTVNTAARMEQNSEPGKINVSEKTYELVKDQFAFTCRGEIAAKNKGMMKMYFAEQVPALAIIQTNA